MFFKSLVSRVILLNILLLIVGIGIFTLIHIRREQINLLSSSRESAELLLSTVKNSIFTAMRTGNSEDVQAILEMVGRSYRLSNVRIFAPDGTILKSARPGEIGRQVNSFDLDLFRHQQREGIFRVDGKDTLGMIQPIVSDERCYLCHGVGHRTIGVLNLNYSLADTAQKLRDSSQSFIITTIVMVLFLSAGVSFILLRFVKRPIQNMMEKMAQVEAGDLSVRMTPRYADEIATLMTSFNSMVDKLDLAKKDLEACHYRQMERADRLASVGEMASGLAHEIKNPLAGISGAISVIADDFAADDPRREVVDKVLEQIGRLDKTATDLLYFGRPGRPEFTYVDVNDLVSKTLFFIAQHPEARNVRRVKDLGRGLARVWVDEKQIQQVLFNVMINGMQAMKEGGTLTIRTAATDYKGRSGVQIEIEDTGPGISREALEDIFVPFFTTKTQGTGLGLPICKQLLENHGGTIGVASRTGQGTTFSIQLPAVDGPDAAGGESDSAQT